MALIKCEECGHMVSDKAQECPNCGCPIQTGIEVVETPKKSGKWKWIAALIVLLLVGGSGAFYFLGGGKDAIAAIEEKVESAIEGSSTSYQIILYDDGSGDFLAPGGKRICGIGHTNGRVEKMDIFLTEEIKLMGIRTKSLDLIDGRIYASYSDYLDYKNGRNENDTPKGKDAMVKEEDEKTVISFDMDDSEVKATNIVNADLSIVPKNNYAIVLYPDKEGTLYDPDKKRICGIKQSIYETTEYEFRIVKPITLYGKETERLAVDHGNVYLNAMDVIYERNGQPSRRVGTANVTKQGNVTIVAFSGNRDSSVGEESYTPARTKTTSPEDRQKMAGWEYLRSHHSEFAHATLNKYLPPTAEPSVALAKALDYPGLSTATYESTYGDTYVVVFTNGTPRTAFNAKTARGDMDSWRSALYYILNNE